MDKNNSETDCGGTSYELMLNDILKMKSHDLDNIYIYIANTIKCFFMYSQSIMFFFRI